MTQKDKILQTLAEVYPTLTTLQGDWCIYGGAAIILAGFDIGATHDIDILTTAEDAETMKRLLADHLEPAAPTKEDHLFRSTFARFRLPLMDVEVAGDLDICKRGRWQRVMVAATQVIHERGMALRIPTTEALARLLRLFGRRKDLERLRIITSKSASAGKE